MILFIYIKVTNLPFVLLWSTTDRRFINGN